MTDTQIIINRYAEWRRPSMWTAEAKPMGRPAVLNWSRTALMVVLCKLLKT